MHVCVNVTHLLFVGVRASVCMTYLLLHTSSSSSRPQGTALCAPCVYIQTRCSWCVCVYVRVCVCAHTTYLASTKHGLNGGLVIDVVREGKLWRRLELYVCVFVCEYVFVRVGSRVTHTHTHTRTYTRARVTPGYTYTYTHTVCEGCVCVCVCAKKRLRHVHTT